jgi:hypothetical protein
METFVVLDVAIGLVFVYLLLALVCTALNEWIAAIFRLRAKTLRRAVERLVDAPSDEGTGDAAARPRSTSRLSHQVLHHPLIRSISDHRGMPAYIPARRFAAALTDAIQASTQARAVDVGGARPTAPQPGDVAKDVEHVRFQLKAIDAATSSERKMATDPSPIIEDWFNEAMERASGWYKRQLLWITLAVAAVITVLANADTLAAARILWHDPSARAALVAQAQERVKRPRPAESGIIQASRYQDENMPVADPGGAEVKPIAPSTRAVLRGGVAAPGSGNASAGPPGNGGAAASAPTTDTATERVSEDDDQRNRDEPAAASDAGLTDDEKAALSQLIGWSREFKAINKDVCAARQQEINDLCRSGAAASEACRKALDSSVADGACVHGGAGLEPTDTFAGRRALAPLVLAHFPGWFLTAVAVSLGAPFWFDTLQRFMNIRGGGKKPDDSGTKDAAKTVKG